MSDKRKMMEIIVYAARSGNVITRQDITSDSFEFSSDPRRMTGVDGNGNKVVILVGKNDTAVAHERTETV